MLGDPQTSPVGGWSLSDGTLWEQMQGGQECVLMGTAIFMCHLSAATEDKLRVSVEDARRCQRSAPQVRSPSIVSLYPSSSLANLISGQQEGRCWSFSLAS